MNFLIVTFAPSPIFIYLGSKYSSEILFSYIFTPFPYLMQETSFHSRTVPLLILLTIPLALQYIEDQGLPTDCWSHFHLFAVRGER